MGGAPQGAEQGNVMKANFCPYCGHSELFDVGTQDDGDELLYCPSCDVYFELNLMPMDYHITDDENVNDRTDRLKLLRKLTALGGVR